MKDVLELQGRVYESRSAICERLGVTFMTLRAWKVNGLLPPAVRIGKADYHDRAELDARLIGCGVQPHEGARVGSAGN